MRFADLPLSGEAEKRPWSGDYWAKNKGGIGYRWKTDEKHDYELPTAEQVQSWTPEQVDLLSPAEKYDLYLENTSFPLHARSKRPTGPRPPAGRDTVTAGPRLRPTLKSPNRWS